MGHNVTRKNGYIYLVVTHRGSERREMMKTDYDCKVIEI
jgi:hypothetical protein